ncbi:MAG: PAS domain S-box protein [Sulfuricaulis sp.]
MKTNKPDLHVPCSDLAGAPVARDFEAKILRLVKGARERHAIKPGQVDAIIDPVSGRAILLPDAQAALLERKERFRSLVELSTDGYWEQDENYRFVLHSGVMIGGDNDILGKTLWDLSFGNSSEIDWSTHRTQLEWRAIFRDLELSYVDQAGQLRIVSISGEPIFSPEARFKGYRGITRDITGSKPAERVAPESDRFARATLDALVAQVCVLDAAGVIITANNAWRVFADIHRGGTVAGVPIGGNYLGVCDQTIGNDSVDAAAMAAGIRQVLAGEREFFRYEYLCDLPSGSLWFMASVTGLHQGGVARAIVSCENITEAKHAEILLQLEYGVARCLADASSSSAGLQAVIRLVCETQHWDRGRYFRLDTAADRLYLAESWGRTAATEQFMERSRAAVFRPGSGLAGRVCQSGQPLWIVNGPEHRRASEVALAHESGKRDAFVFPVIAQGSTIGVLDFSGRMAHEPDERLLQAARDIGQQLGQFLQRCQAEDALRLSETRFRRLTELSSDWVWEQDRDFRFTKIVGIGMAGVGDILGKTLWELPTIILSDDEWVRYKTELAAQWSFCDLEFSARFPDGQLGYYRISGEPVFDGTGAFTGFHGTGLDITRQKRAELALCTADR